MTKRDGVRGLVLGLALVPGLAASAAAQGLGGRLLPIELPASVAEAGWVDQVERVELAGVVTLPAQELDGKRVGLPGALVLAGPTVARVRLVADLSRAERPAGLLLGQPQPAPGRVLLVPTLRSLELELTPPARLPIGRGRTSEVGRLQFDDPDAPLPPLAGHWAADVARLALDGALTGRAPLGPLVTRVALAEVTLTLPAGARGPVGAETATLREATRVVLREVEVDGDGGRGLASVDLALAGPEGAPLAWATRTGHVQAGGARLRLEARVETGPRGWQVTGLARPGSLELRDVAWALPGGPRLGLERLALEVAAWEVAASDEGGTARLTLATTFEGLALAWPAQGVEAEGGRLTGRGRLTVLAPPGERLALALALEPGARLEAARVLAPVADGQLELAGARVTLGAAALPSAGALPVERVEARGVRLTVEDAGDGADGVVVAGDLAVALQGGGGATWNPADGRVALGQGGKLAFAAASLALVRAGHEQLAARDLALEVETSPAGFACRASGTIPVGAGDARASLARLELARQPGQGLRVVAASGQVALDLPAAEAALRQALDDELRRHEASLFGELDLGLLRLQRGRLVPSGPLRVALGEAPNTLDVSVEATLVVDRSVREIRWQGLHTRVEWADAGPLSILDVALDGRLELTPRPGPLAGLQLGLVATARRVRLSPRGGVLRGLRPTIPLLDATVFRGDVLALPADRVARWPEPLRHLTLRRAALARDADLAVLRFEADGQ